MAMRKSKYSDTETQLDAKTGGGQGMAIEQSPSARRTANNPESHETWNSFTNGREGNTAVGYAAGTKKRGCVTF